MSMMVDCLRGRRSRIAAVGERPNSTSSVPCRNDDDWRLSVRLGLGLPALEEELLALRPELTLEVGIGEVDVVLGATPLGDNRPSLPVGDSRPLP
jgi:hypothetical protein